MMSAGVESAGCPRGTRHRQPRRAGRFRSKVAMAQAGALGFRCRRGRGRQCRRAAAEGAGRRWAHRCGAGHRARRAPGTGATGRRRCHAGRAGLPGADGCRQPTSRQEVPPHPRRHPRGPRTSRCRRARSAGGAGEPTHATGSSGGCRDADGRRARVRGAPLAESLPAGGAAGVAGGCTRCWSRRPGSAPCTRGLAGRARGTSSRAPRSTSPVSAPTSPERPVPALVSHTSRRSGRSAVGHVRPPDRPAGADRAADTGRPAGPDARRGVREVSRACRGPDGSRRTCRRPSAHQTPKPVTVPSPGRRSAAQATAGRRRGRRRPNRHPRRSRSPPARAPSRPCPEEPPGARTATDEIRCPAPSSPVPDLNARPAGRSGYRGTVIRHDPDPGRDPVREPPPR